MSDSAPVATGEAGKTTLAARLEYWLKIIPLITSAIAGVLALVPQTADLFGPFDYAAETLLAVCVIGLIVFALALILTAPPEQDRHATFSAPRRIIGLIIIVAAPLLAFLLWYTALRLPPEIADKVQREIALGDTELLVLDDPAAARTHYLKALQLAPRRGSIRTKIKVAEEQMKGK